MNTKGEKYNEKKNYVLSVDNYSCYNFYRRCV